MSNKIEDYKEKCAHLKLVKEFVKSKAKQFKLKPSMQTYFMDDAMGMTFIDAFHQDLADAGPDMTSKKAETLGYVLLRYDPQSKDVDVSINDFYLNGKQVTRRLTDSLMILFMDDEETGPIMLTLLRQMGMYFITAVSETKALMFLSRYFPEE